MSEYIQIYKNILEFIGIYWNLAGLSASKVMVGDKQDEEKQNKTKTIP